VRERPATSDDLATATETNPRALTRVLRALAAFGIFRRDRHGRYHLTRRAWPLLSDVNGSIRHWVVFVGRHETWQSYQFALESVRTGECGFDLAHGESFYRYCQTHQELGNEFILGMSGWTDWQAQQIVRHYDFDRFKTVVDVGGGRGSLVIEILKRYEHVRGILYDLPESIEAARQRVEDAGHSDRCHLVAGSFLEQVPAEGDAYLLKHVLRDWDDQNVLRILKNCHEAMPAQATLLVVDATLDPRDNRDRLLKLIDLEQMSLLTGILRTREEFNNLLGQAGFKLIRSTRTPVADASILEARKQ
jgi:hypothetical protein